MKHIAKGAEPTILSNIKKKYRNRYRRSAKYSDLDMTERHELKKILSAEQYYLCAYCMVSIWPDASHIEHIKPQSKYPNDTLDYQNIVASCIRKKSCGDQKDNWYDANQFVSPLDPLCENEFTYLLDGTIVASTPRGETTIEKLNLNSHLLKLARKSAIFSSNFYSPDFQEKKDKYLEMYIVPDANGCLPDFCCVVEWCFQNI